MFSLSMIPGVRTVQTVAICAAVTVLVSGLAYVKGRADGKTIERAATFAAIERQREQRNEINETVRNLDDAALCRELGGLPVNGECK